jgi:hypothetical protein
LVALLSPFALLISLNAQVWLPDAHNQGREMERIALDAATDKAIGELSNSADRVPFNRRLCVEHDRMYLSRSVHRKKG